MTTLPNWMLPLNSPGVVNGFYQGLWSDVPWGAWLGPIFWAGSIALAITAIGLGLTALFQKQWAQHERLVYPLAEVSLELTEGFDQKPGWPAIYAKARHFGRDFLSQHFPSSGTSQNTSSPIFPASAIFDPMFGRTGRQRRRPAVPVPLHAICLLLPHPAHSDGIYFFMRPEHPVQHLVDVCARRTGGTIRHEPRGLHSRVMSGQDSRWRCVIVNLFSQTGRCCRTGNLWGNMGSTRGHLKQRLEIRFAVQLQANAIRNHDPVAA